MSYSAILFDQRAVNRKKGEFGIERAVGGQLARFAQAPEQFRVLIDELFNRSEKR